MTADNAIYTPNPATISVIVYADDDDNIKADSGPAHLVALKGEVLRRETAKVVGRGNLISDSTRWYQVKLSDGSRHYVLAAGS